MKRFVFILLILCAVLLAPLEAFANDGANAVDKADMIYVDESSNGLYQLYYTNRTDHEWYIYHTETEEYEYLYHTSFETNYMFWGNYIAELGQYETNHTYQIIDPDPNVYRLVDLKLEDTTVYKEEAANYRQHILSLSWHEASQSFVQLSSFDNLWLDFFDLDGNWKRSIKTPFKQQFYRDYSDWTPEFNMLHMWGDFAVFYHFPGIKDEHGVSKSNITFYNINDGTYWFGKGEMFRAHKDSIIVMDYDYDDYGNIYLQVELYVDGLCVDTLWHSVSGVYSGNISPYNYPENILHFNDMIFDFTKSKAYRKE